MTGYPQKAPLMGLQSITSIVNPAVNGWARENLIEQSSTTHLARVWRWLLSR